MTLIIEGYRRVIVQHTAPDLPALVGALAIGLVLLSLAYVVFKRAERTFADVI
jgi:ABC-type polysaccharide/polyol phosphate export permease